jgi:alkylresorcinol/alkylpyrone synthase
VLLFSVELPSLTFQPADRSSDNLTAAMVFGDGAGAALLETTSGGRGLLLEAAGTRLVPEGSAQLGFELRDGGLRVVLSRELPSVVRQTLRPAVEQFLESQETSLAEVDVIAAHPGGPRIFDAIEAALDLSPSALAASRRVFEQFGNASSAGIFFVLEALRNSAAPGRILALAFGPGLSIELALMRLSA